MSDNIQITQGSGTTMATTDVGGVHHQRVRISGAETSVFAEISNPDGRVKVELPAGASGLSDTELRASSLDVHQVSGSVDSVSITNASLPVTGTFWQATQPVSGTVRPIQVRGSLKTAYVTLTNGAETSLLAGTSGEFNDLIWISFTNLSTAAIALNTGTQVDIRSTTGGPVVLSAYVENKKTVVITPAVPIPMNTAADAWTVDRTDVGGGSNILVSALFSRET